MKIRRSLPVALAAVLLTGCASLGGLASAVQPPSFQVASGREAEIRLLGPSVQNPLGAASVRLWADISNPNPFGVVLSALTGTLALEGTRAADIDLPWGLPLVAGQDTVVPLDISVSFADLPGLGNVLSRAVTEGAVDYSLDGTVTLDAGLLGQPSFGPTNFLQGSIRTRR